MPGGIDLGTYIRLASVVKVKATTIDFQFLDLSSEPPRTVDRPNPYASQSGGIFFGIQEGDLVLVSCGPFETWYVVGVVPNNNYNNQTYGVDNTLYYQNQYPQLNQGEISLVGKYGQFIDVVNTGNIALGTSIGQKSSNFELSNLSQAIFTRTNQIYTFTEAGRTSEGIIRRDLSTVEDSNITNTTNFLDGENYDLLLDSIGRSSQNEVQKRTTQVIKKTVRNPALVEKRELIYEYADIFNVQDFNTEIQAIADIRQKDGSIDISALKKDITTRQNRRTDTLDLNQQNFNQLIERIQGTVVDIYGNILDINRNIVPVPASTTLNTATGNDVSGLKYIYDYLRRSIKYHFEINSRKDLNTSTVILDPNTNYGQLSRFSMDIDGEGQIKVNIPASSETGNVPILGRYTTQINPNDPTDGTFRASNRIDQELTQFGANSASNPDEFSGQTITNNDYLEQSTQDQTVTVGTAFHDIMAIANNIFANGSLPNLSVGPVSKTITNKILAETDPAFNSNKPNAGGRSAHVNLDGSMVLNVGANTVDRNSITVDTAGGLISHYGRDINGRSVISQFDGDILVQVGGNQISTDPRFPVGSLPNDPALFRVGRAEIHLVNSSDGSIPDTVLVIDENGININSQGSIIMKADQNIILDAGGELLLNGESIYYYSTDYNTTTGEINAAEQRQGRNGRSS